MHTVEKYFKLYESPNEYGFESTLNISPSGHTFQFVRLLLYEIIVEKGDNRNQHENNTKEASIKKLKYSSK